MEKQGVQKCLKLNVILLDTAHHVALDFLYLTVKFYVSLFTYKVLIQNTFEESNKAIVQWLFPRLY